MSETIHHIWPPETGIRDIDGDWRDFQASEVGSIREVWKRLRSDLKGTTSLDEFNERLAREWAIETGILEDVYDIERGVTLTLIEHGFRAELLGHGDTDKPREYVLQLLHDQKDALEGVFDFVARRRYLSTSYIKELHAALLRSQTHTDALDPQGRPIQVPLIRGDWKVQPNYPTRNGATYAYCPPEHVASEMDRLVAMHLQHVADKVAPEVAAAWLHHRFTQIHPFQDGNGRVARALATLVLVQAGLFPLVVTRDDKIDYIEALEAADAGDLRDLVALIAKLQLVQFRKATAIMDAVSATRDEVEQVLEGLLETAGAQQARHQQRLRRVFDISRELEKDVEARLNAIAPTVAQALQRVAPTANCSVTVSDSLNEHYFRYQIIQNARNHLHYFADTSEYRAWVSLDMFWRRRAKLVFAFHGIGRPFNGSLVAAPFLEFRDQDEEGEARITLTPIADEPFIFFHTDTAAAALARFRPWREKVIAVALQELRRNL
jgi:Fic family protein